MQESVETIQAELEERLRFEELLSNISSRFVNITPDRVDPEINHSLKQILEFFQVDRVGLLQVLPSKSSFRITHVVSVKDLPPLPVGEEIPQSFYPWSYDKVTREREVLSLHRLDDLPAEADVDRQSYIRTGVRSTLDIPIFVTEPVGHVIVMQSFKSERLWPGEFVPRLRLLGEIFANALERKQIRLQIEERLRFEGLISNLSSAFINLPPDQIDGEIEGGQRHTCELLDLDRSALFQLQEGEPRVMVLTCLYQSKGSAPVPERVNATDFFPWTVQKVLSGETVTIEKMSDLPSEAARDRENYRLYGTKSTVIVPLSIGGGPIFGALTFVATREERDWPETIVKGFQLIAQVFANALARKRAEAEAFQARRQLLQLDRLSRMGELTASLAHELNQPLAAILSNAQAGLRFLQSGKIDLDEFREILQDIAQDGLRAGNVIRGLRSMVKREEVERDLINLNDVLNEIVQIFHTEAIFRNVRVETEFEELLPPVLGNKVQLQQVALNLILNATDAISDNPPEYRQVVLHTGVKDNRIRVTARDFGPGIDKANLQRIFEPFFTTKGVGLGMGLNICRSIVEAHGGHIWAENNPDGGATFFIDLPIYQSGK